MKKRTLFIFLMAFSALGVKAQSIGPSTINSAGGSAVVSGNTYEWSVAEMTLVSTGTAGSITVTQGILQPQSIPTGISETGSLTSQMQVYPNPAQTQVFLQPSFSAGDEMVYTLYDATGKSLATRKVVLQTGKELQTIDLRAFAAGQYMLQVNLKHKGAPAVISYKIQKIN